MRMYRIFKNPLYILNNTEPPTPTIVNRLEPVFFWHVFINLESKTIAAGRRA